MSLFDSAHLTSYSTLVGTVRLSRTVFEYNELFVKSRFKISHLCLAQPLEMTQFEIRQDHWHQKNRVRGLSHGAVLVIP